MEGWHTGIWAVLPGHLGRIRLRNLGRWGREREPADTPRGSGGREGLLDQIHQRIHEGTQQPDDGAGSTYPSGGCRRYLRLLRIGRFGGLLPQRGRFVEAFACRDGDRTKEQPRPRLLTSANRRPHHPADRPRRPVFSRGNRQKNRQDGLESRPAPALLLDFPGGRPGA